MRRVCTESGRRAWLLADGVAPAISERAARHDADGTFPHQDFDDLRSAGYLALTAPEELGGHGAALPEMIIAQERLAAASGPTALAANMHLSITGQLARRWRAAPTGRLTELLGEVVAGRVLFAPITAEPGHSLVRSTGSKATRVDGGFRVRGRKVFGTNSEVMTHLVSIALDVDHPDGPHVIGFRVPVDSETIQPVAGTWHSGGMRATVSQDVELLDVFVPEDAVTFSFPEGMLDGSLLQNLWGWSMPSFGAVYLGIARGALTAAIAEVDRRGWQDRSGVRALLSEAEMRQSSAWALVSAVAEEVMGNGLWRDGTVQDGMARVVLAKHVATITAVEVVDLVARIVGSSVMRAGSVFERAWRDVRAGTVHPYSTTDAMDLIADTVLGRSVAAERRPDVETLPAQTPGAALLTATIPW
ncbi:alkylation response protein AidB-like acyl-CoA dehydrogenase [Actinoalloteichus hoggarensis]|uniref:Putative acyl-CoA dehydrogenase YdbM n=1 Tax=Actinoalloteichus hoggarensis TaxID=1470176 RepID=A0A221W555_9PSEU|nr:acyl-CoA dehydrogenase family protein [Actinoalloteichus hoggarensis]ASO20679.1 Putative acyl-CoA dehydrogenase YdbM [Actinoalloteichus hoggarensis]MBB5924468.1 alkylation response protein AidB-like acyl-CoA dehydrogenase [Actinoalloteichus hoggarensis]